MVTIDDIAGLITTQLAAQSNFAAVFPGDVIFDRGPDTPTAWPYGIFTIKPQAPSLCFDDAYIQDFLVTLAGYSPPESVIPPETTQTVQAFFASTFTTDAAVLALCTTPLRNPTERVMHSKPLPGTGQFAPQLRQGSDIFISGLTIEIRVQGDRSQS